MPVDLETLSAYVHHHFVQVNGGGTNSTRVAFHALLLLKTLLNHIQSTIFTLQ